MNNISLNKGTSGTVAIIGGDNISGLIATAVAVVSTFTLGVTYTIYTVSDAEALGITSEYDTTNKVVLYHHIKEFYRLAGENTKLFLMGVAQTVTMEQIAEDTGNVYTKKLIADSNGEIRQLAIARNPADGYTAVMEQGIEDDVLKSIPKAQALAEWGYETARPFQVVIEGRGYGGSAATLASLRALVLTVDIPAPKVSVCIGQDWTHADGLDTLNKKYASVGLMLGCIAKIQVNYNIGEVGTMNLTDVGADAYINAGFSDHTKAVENENDWSVLDTKGWIFPYIESGEPGYRWNNDHVCVAAQIDIITNVINENTIAYGRTMDKAARMLRKAFAPLIKSVAKVDATTGKLKTGMVKYFEGIGSAALEVMEGNSEISGFNVAVDKDSDLLTGDKALKVYFDIVPYGTINKIAGYLNLKTSI